MGISEWAFVINVATLLQAMMEEIRLISHYFNPWPPKSLSSSASSLPQGKAGKDQLVGLSWPLPGGGEEVYTTSTHILLAGIKSHDRM